MMKSNNILKIQNVPKDILLYLREAAAQQSATGGQGFKYIAAKLKKINVELEYVNVLKQENCVIQGVILMIVAAINK